MASHPPLPPSNSETREMTRARDSFIGPYRIELKIGDGGMGMVYKCFDSKLKRFVALKVLKEKYSRDPKHHERFQREAQAIASVSHPNIVQIYAIEEGNEKGNGLPPYLVMEYIDGSSAEALLSMEGPLWPGRAAWIIREAAFGLKAAFEKGIIHRDVKPSNILIAADGSVKIVDFGLAKAVEGTGSITEEGMVLGTPHYIPPEQGRGQPADQRSDIYSLGATFYHLVTGRPPFESQSQLGVIVAHIHQIPEPPHRTRKEVPEAMSLVIGKMLAKDPARRYQGYGELLDDLERLARGEAVAPETALEGAATFRPAAHHVPPRFWWAAGGAVALAVCVTLWVAARLFPIGPGEPGALQRLGGWYLAQEGNEVLDLSFATSLPEGLTRTEVLETVFLTARVDAGQVSLEPPGPRLHLRNLQSPAAFRFPFRRLDEVHLWGLRTESTDNGPVDIGVALVHPRGDGVRLLLFRLSSLDRVPEPILAERNAYPVPLDPAAPAAPRLGTGPFDLEVRFQPEADSVRVHFAVRRSARPGETETGETIYQSDGGDWIRLPGTDWNSGALAILPISSTGPSSLTIARIQTVGLIDHQEALKACPWDTQKTVAKIEHGKADRR